jgi:hypothetical protein
MPADAIQERDGIPYINSGACGPGGGTEEKLDQGFKDLIAEVVKRPPPS